MVKATGIGSGRNAVMEFLEEKYDENADIDSAIKLGLEALYKATEGKITIDTIEVAAIYAEDNRFKKLGMDDLEAHVKSVLESKPQE
jgi:proteasome alpha subunit